MNHADFAAALFDPARACPGGLRAWNGSDPAVRFAVHRNNVVVSLVDALADGFPVVRTLVGDDFFDHALARDFVVAHPPRSPVLAEWGDELPDFIESYEPAAELPYLADVARLEHARLRACNAADAPRLDDAAVAARLSRPAALPAARLVLHPSLRVVDSPCAVVSLWAAHQDDLDALATLDWRRPEAALVLRDDDDGVVVAKIDAPAARWLRAVTGGATLAQAARAAPDADLAAAFALLLRHRALVAWRDR